MKNAFLNFMLPVVITALGAGRVHAATFQDTSNLQTIQQQIGQSIAEIEQARAANGYDTQGHALNAEKLLRQAQQTIVLLGTQAAQGVLKTSNGAQGRN